MISQFKNFRIFRNVRWNQAFDDKECCGVTAALQYKKCKLCFVDTLTEAEDHRQNCDREKVCFLST